jgi:hypothetical protein
MKTTTLISVLIVCVILASCQIYHTIRPLRLYSMGDGSLIEVFLQQKSRDGGRLVSAEVQGERFHGEYVIYDRVAYRDGQYSRGNALLQSVAKDSTELRTFAELYGFGEHSDARPVGTGILVGDQGTMIEIVLYRVSANLEAGDGVAKDNRGGRYRVFLSVEQE